MGPTPCMGGWDIPASQWGAGSSGAKPWRWHSDAPDRFLNVSAQQQGRNQRFIVRETSSKVHIVCVRFSLSFRARLAAHIYMKMRCGFWKAHAL